MSPRLLPLFSALALSATLAAAQEPVFSASPRPEIVKVSAPAPAPEAAATPAPARKPGFFQRIFSKDRAAATPKATPTATPVKRRPAVPPRRPAADEKPETEAPKPAPEKAPEPKTETPKPAPETETETPAATPAPKNRNGRKPTPPPAKTGPTKEQQALEKATASGDPDAIEKAKYDEAHARAVADPKVMELQEKASAATTEEEGRKALRAYNKAVFQKMRALEPGIDGRVDRMEAAVMKRLGE